MEGNLGKLISNFILETLYKAIQIHKIGMFRHSSCFGAHLSLKNWLPCTYCP